MAFLLCTLVVLFVPLLFFFLSPLLHQFDCTPFWANKPHRNLNRAGEALVETPAPGALPVFHESEDIGAGCYQACFFTPAPIAV